jgi:hypothetical protein
MEHGAYDAGYRVGRAGTGLPKTPVSKEWREGYEDGRGEWKMAQGVRPVDADYYEVNHPPAGFRWAGRKAVPQPGEWYAQTVRAKAQTRHILIPSR